jgi:PPOX class probable F420-dependent enzyme
MYVTAVTIVAAGALKLTAAQARQRFAGAPVARLATLGPAGRPHLVPITFAVDGDRIYTVVDAKPKTTTNLRRLRNIRADPRVTVLADHYEADWDRLWWARAEGLASVLGGPAAGGIPAPARPRADLAGPLGLLAARYPQYRRSPPDGPVIVIQVERWTGWAAGGPA